MKEIVVIEGPRYSEARELLEADPIIKTMAREVIDSFWSTFGSEMALVTLREYRSRGGEIETHIGGPFEAIHALILKGTEL